MIDDQHLARCSECFEECRQRFETLALGLSSFQASWKPGAGKWSVSQCIEHLDISITPYVDPLERALDRARSEGLTGAGPWTRWTLPGKFLLRGLDPAANRSLPAPPSFRPAPPGKLDTSSVFDSFRLALDRLIHLAQEADGLDLDRVRVATPVGPLVRVTAAEAFEIHALHIPRHLGQAERVIEHPDYPAS